jgi:hypothetical protein
MGQLAKGSGRKNASVEIHPAQFLDFGIWRDRIGTFQDYFLSRHLSLIHNSYSVTMS